LREGHGALLYDEAAQHAAQQRLLAPDLILPPDSTLPNSHPPYESLFAAAFGDAPIAVPFAAWTLLELLSVAAALWLLARSTPLAPTARWLAILGALAYQPLHALLLTGQSSTLVLLGLVGLYAALKADRQGWAGVALALLLIKPQLALPILLLLLLSRAWRPLLIAGAIHAALAVAVMPLLGIAWPLSYLRYLAGSRHWDHRMFEHAPLMHNWRSLAAHLIEPVAPALASPAVTLLTALSVALLAWAWWRQRPNFHQPPPSIGGPRIALTDLLWALATIVTILIAHHLYIHDLTLLIFPAWLMVAGATATGWPHPRLWLALATIGSLLPIVTAALAQRQWQISLPSIALLATTALALAWTILHPSPGRADPPPPPPTPPPTAHLMNPS
ncbi:MAG: glycosyltransferase family 87 protein, partial [Thermomicrobiales bacterium]